MSYKVNRAVGYQPWGVTNPWVFADLSQPQRQRGNVSPMVFQTAGPYLKSAHLGEVSDLSPEQQAEVEKIKQAVQEQARSDQQHTIAWIGLAVSAGALALSYASYREFRRKRLQPNRKRGRRRMRRRNR